MVETHPIDVEAEELRFHHASGRACLDLVATIGERWRRRFERLRSPSDLDRWLEEVGLASPAPAAPRHLEAARRLRGAIEQLAIAAMAGTAYPDGALAEVNRFAAAPDPVPQLTGEGPIAEVRAVDAALSAVARDAIALFGGPLAARVRECAADDCALVFVDTSRPGSRRWCSMRVCGNRMKVARHRQRQR